MDPSRPGPDYREGELESKDGKSRVYCWHNISRNPGRLSKVDHSGVDVAEYHRDNPFFEGDAMPQSPYLAAVLSWLNDSPSEKWPPRLIDKRLGRLDLDPTPSPRDGVSILLIPTRQCVT